MSKRKLEIKAVKINLFNYLISHTQKCSNLTIKVIAVT